MPAGATIIGRVAVKVLPDTTNFRREAQAQLNEQEKGLRVKAQIVPELRSEEVKANARALKTELDRELDGITLRVDLTGEASVKAAIERLKAELARLREQKIHVELNEDEINKGLGMLQERLKEIERFRFKVDPNDTASLQRALDQIERELASRKELKVAIRTDTPSLEKAAEEIRARLSEAGKIQARIDEASKIRVTRDAQQVVTRVRAALTRINFAPGVDQAKLNQTVLRIEQELFKVEELHARISTELDPVAKRRLEIDLAQLQARIDHIIASVQPEVDEKSELGVRARLAALGRNIVAKVKIDVDTKSYASALVALSGFRIIRTIHNENLNLAKSLDLVTVRLGKYALMAGAAAAASLAFSANLLSLGSGLVSIGGAAFALPGIFGGIAVGLGLSAVALKDFNNQLPAFAIGAGKTASVWKQLQDTISTNFWSEAKKPFEDFFTTILPKFSAGAAQASGALGGFFGSLATGLKQSLGGRLQGMFANLTASIHIATGATGGLSNIVGVLGQVGASYLPRLAQFFTKVTNQFSAFLTKAQNDGSLKRWIDTGIEAMKSLGHIIGNVVGIFHGLAKAANAAGSGNALGGLNDALKAINDTVNSPWFQKGLIGVFKAAHQAISNLVTMAGPALKSLFASLSSTLAAVLPSVGTTIGTLAKALATTLNNPAVQNGIKSVFGGLSAAANALAPALSRLGPTLGALLKFAGNALGPLADVVGAFLDFTNVAAEFLPVLTPVVKLLAGTFAKVLRDLTPTMASLAKVAAQLFSQTFTAMAPVFRQLAPTLVSIGKLFASLFKAIAPIIPQIAKALAPVLVTLGKAFVQISDALTPVMPVLGKALLQAFQAIAPVLPPIVKAVADFAVSLVKLLAALMPILGPILQATAAFSGFALMIVGKVITALANLATFIADTLTAVITGLIATFTNLSEFTATVWSAIKNAITGAINAVKSTVSSVLAALSSAWHSVMGSINSTTSSVWNTIKSTVTNAINAIKSAISAVLASISNTWHSTWNSLTSFFSGIWNTLRSYASNGISGIWDQISSLPGKITALGGKMLSAGKSMMAELFHGIENAAQNVGSFAANIGKTIVNAVVDGLNSLLPHHLHVGMPGPVPDIDVDLIPYIPHIAKGATILPKAGGTVALLAEAGKAETVVDTGKMNKLIDLALGRNDGSAIGGSRVLNYYAAPGSSIDSEEDLFAASERARFVL